MGNVVIARVDWIDFDSTTVDIELVDSLDHSKEKTVLIDLEHAPLDDLGEHDVYVPATLIDSVQGGNVKVYHELDQYVFFQQAKEVILEDGVPKGVFRLRRVIDGEKNSAVIASDLCVLTSVFGESERIVIKQSRAGLEPQHVIVMISFGGGTMAHVDYTFSNKEQVELEWSGIGRIIEFNSDEMNPLEPEFNVPLTLQYNVDSILQSSKGLDVMRDEFQRFQQLVGGVKE